MPKFHNVTPQVDLPAMEQGVLRFWKETDVFGQSQKQTADGPRFVFYEGPPTANGRPGIHHVIARVFKDIFPRYKTMRGYFVSRKGGWDTQGLPVELETEKKLGFSGKKAIEDYGVAAFNQKCRESVFAYVEEWERMTERIGYWVDLPTAYMTLTNDYVESLWWILKQYWDRGLIYQGYKVVPYCPRCGTPLSSHELAQGYQEGTRDPSVFIKFPLADRIGEYLLVWTTTPWTLPGNVAVAVGEALDYVLVEHAGDRLWLAEALLEKVLGSHLEHARVIRRVKGREMLGWHYKPLYTFLPVTQDYCYVIPGDFVSTEDGTGLVHIAPAFGADDLAVGQKFGLPTLMNVDPQGRFVDAVTPWRGIFVKDADPLIQQELTDRGLMFKQGIYEHTYPFCWRCDTPLLYYARTTWYIKTTAFKDRLLANNNQINWVPEHIKQGRFGDWLANNIDWGLARERYWGTPLPFWVCDNPACDHTECVGSVAELGEKTGRKFMNPKYLAQQMNRWPDPEQLDREPLDLHRPAVDALTWPCPKCGGTLRRVPEVADAWFDSGSMPVAQWHYPFENRALFTEQFPADYICEAVDQTRGWFYTLHAVSTLLFDQPCFKNVICLGHIMAEDGGKMSKSRGNMADPWSVLDAHGADATRWYMFTASPPGNPRRFSANLVKEVVGKFLLTLWNSYSFFVTYANLNDFDPAAPQVPLAERSVLDRWVLAKLNSLVENVTAALETYDVTGATRPIADFVDELSNWYVRLSRRRFWNTGDLAAGGQGDKVTRWQSESTENVTASPDHRVTLSRDSLAAHQTMYEVLVTVSHLLAPFTPFIADEMYRNLVCCGAESDQQIANRKSQIANPQSVHLSQWPAPKPAYADAQLVADMALAQRVVSLGRAAREGANLKLRQPLAEAIVGLPTGREAEALARLADAVVKEELNVKALRTVTASSDLVDVAIHPLPKQLGQKYGRRFPAIKAALLALDPLVVAAAVEAGQGVAVAMDGEMLTVLPEELEVRKSPKKGLAVAEDAGYLVAVTTELTDALRWEGWAREVSRNIQELRKKSGFEISDRIHTTVQAGPKLAPVWAQHGAEIAADTLSLTFAPAAPAADAFTASLVLDGEEVLIGVRKA
ncbi:MAG: isoleucine--tRNA ligase [Chloroflexi bacterium]|nr:isoleucine--tRNA ligase [Chloroflexota bacterium]